MEAYYETSSIVPLYIGGIVDTETQKVSYKIEAPKALSFLAFGDFDVEVKELNDFPKDEHPNVAIVHYAFQVMVGLGLLLIFVGILFLITLSRKRTWFNSLKF